jgi:hypothetical protein
MLEGNCAPNAVMLNLFQHPSKPRSAAAKLLQLKVLPRQTALGWMLKQVQHDGVW